MTQKAYAKISTQSRRMVQEWVGYWTMQWITLLETSTLQDNTVQISKCLSSSYLAPNSTLYIYLSSIQYKTFQKIEPFQWTCSRPWRLVYVVQKKNLKIEISKTIYQNLSTPISAVSSGYLANSTLKKECDSRVYFVHLVHVEINLKIRKRRNSTFA